MAPLKPARKGRLLLLLMMFLRLSLLSKGSVPWIGKKLSLGFENAMPLPSELAMIPVTTLADGWEPPRMSCM